LRRQERAAAAGRQTAQKTCRGATVTDCPQRVGRGCEAAAWRLQGIGCKLRCKKLHNWLVAACVRSCSDMQAQLRQLWSRKQQTSVHVAGEAAVARPAECRSDICSLQAMRTTEPAAAAADADSVHCVGHDTICIILCWPVAATVRCEMSTYSCCCMTRCRHLP
jgi:hypothetical protein